MGPAAPLTTSVGVKSKWDLPPSPPEESISFETLELLLRAELEIFNPLGIGTGLEDTEEDDDDNWWDGATTQVRFSRPTASVMFSN